MLYAYGYMYIYDINITNMFLRNCWFVSVMMAYACSQTFFVFMFADELIYECLGFLNLDVVITIYSYRVYMYFYLRSKGMGNIFFSCPTNHVLPEFQVNNSKQLVTLRLFPFPSAEIRSISIKSNVDLTLNVSVQYRISQYTFTKNTQL